MTMFDTDQFQQWANKGHWSNWERKPERTELLRQLVYGVLNEAPDGATLGTVKLVEAMLPGLDALGRTYVSNGLAYLRNHGMVDGCYKRGPKNPRTFGNKSIVWVNPQFNHPDGSEGLESIL